MNLEWSTEMFIEQMDMPKELASFLDNSILLLPGEVKNDYFVMLSMLVSDTDPQTSMEWLCLFDLAALIWSMQRYRKWKHDAILSIQTAEVERALLKSDVSSHVAGGLTPKVRLQAEIDARRWGAGGPGKLAIQTRIGEFGYNEGSIQGEAFAGSIAVHHAMDQLLATNRRQISRLLNDMMFRREFRERARRSASRETKSDAVTIPAVSDSQDGV